MNSIHQRSTPSASNSKYLFISVLVRAEVIEKATEYQAQLAPANMTLLIKNVELSIPQGTPAAYLAELIGELS